MKYGEHKYQKKTPEKGHVGTHFEYKNYSDTVLFLAFTEQSFIFCKILRIKFSSWLPKFLPPVPCFCSQKSNSAQNVHRPMLYPLLCPVSL